MQESLEPHGTPHLSPNRETFGTFPPIDHWQHEILGVFDQTGFAAFWLDVMVGSLPPWIIHTSAAVSDKLDCYILLTSSKYHF
jgi:hypothetical protein